MINNACKIPSENVNNHRDEQAVKADFLDPRNEFFLNRWGASLSNNFFRKSSDNTPIPDNRYSFTEGTPKSNSPPTNPDWADNFDAGSFRRDLDQLREKIACSLGPEDIQHLRKIERRGRIASVIGYATIWLIPNPLTAFLLSFGQITRWLLAHQILHRAYDKVPDVPPRYTSKVFAKGWRRFVDWFDWINPEAWHQEHNILHHYYTGEEKDPDLIERNVESIRKASMAKIFKYGTAALTAMTWRFSYYAPNTISTVDPGNLHKRSSLNPSEFLTIRDLLNFKNPHVRKLWATCYLPYGLFHFVLLPLLFLPFGTGVALCVLGNKILAECILNVHSFFVIGSNHTGSDLYRFDYHIQNKEQFYTHQVLGSANYHTGGDTLDHLQIWLNYQIEHHLFPDIPMLKYQEIQPEVKRLCEKHGIPYIQESVFTRTRKMVDVWVGNTHMMEMKKFPSP